MVTRYVTICDDRVVPKTTKWPNIGSVGALGCSILALNAFDGFGLNSVLCIPIQLDDKPIQHREVMNHESELFKSYFKTITLLEGG